jgi:MFS transporter, FSR family, fosmidomycin resistance protein
MRDEHSFATICSSAVLLPILGAFLNGTSSALYATVAQLVAPEAHTRGYGLFSMLYQGSGMVAPVLCGCAAMSQGWDGQ